MRALAAFLLLSGAGATAAEAQAQFAAPAALVRSDPETPARGAAAWLEVADDPSRNDLSPITGVEGEAAGEPLHFAREERGWTALFGIPLEGGDSLGITLVLARGERVDTSSVRLAVRQPDYPRERITVPPRMVEYDSAIGARIEAEGRRARDVSRRSHDTPRLWSLPLALPRPGRITSPYGGAREYNGKVTSRHTGTDFAGPVGAPIVAPTRGVVAMVVDFYLAGKAVYLDHGAGLVTGYFHLSRADVAAGDTVQSGQRIGAVGRSGRVTGPHLHWIMRYGTISIDPMTLVELGRRREK